MIRKTLDMALLTVTALFVTVALASAQTQTSRPFSGAKVNGGTVTSTVKAGKIVLMLSEDSSRPIRRIRTGRS